MTFKKAIVTSMIRCAPGFVIAAFIAALAPALAIDFTTPLKEPDGSPAMTCTKRSAVSQACEIVGPPFTLGLAVRDVLNATFPDEQNLPGEEKFKRWGLAQSLVGASEVKLTAEDVALLKKLTGKAYPPSTVHQIWTLLDPALAPPK